MLKNSIAKIMRVYWVFESIKSIIKKRKNHDKD